MQLDDLKKSMSTLEQALAKTNNEITLDVSASVTAQAKLLKNFRKGFISCLILAVVFAATAIGDISPVSIPLHIKIYLSSFLALGAIWYIYLHHKLKDIHIASITPSQLFSETSTIKLLTISGEIFFGGCLIVLFALLLPHEWIYNPIGFWTTAIVLVIGIILGLIHYIPQYRKLFCDLNSVKE